MWSWRWRRENLLERLPEVLLRRIAGRSGNADTQKENENAEKHI